MGKPETGRVWADGEYWSDIGWKVLVQFTPLTRRVRLKNHMDVLPSLLPPEHSPLRSTGGRYQRYLTRLTPEFGEVLAGLIGAEAQTLIASISVATPMQTGDDLDYWEHKIEVGIEDDTELPATDREAIIVARRVQGLFKQRVMEIEERCRITGVTNQVHLIAVIASPGAIPRTRSGSVAKTVCCLRRASTTCSTAGSSADLLKAPRTDG